MTMRAFEITIATSMSDAEQAVRDALGRKSFGVVSEIDVATNLNNALGTQRAPLKILGACNPMLADRALNLDPSVALMLPCNVVLEAVDGGIRVRAVDPHELIDDPRFASLIDEAADALRSAVAELSTATSA